MREIKKVKQKWDMDQKVLFKSKLNEMKAINEKIQMEQENEWKIKEVEWKAENEVLKNWKMCWGKIKYGKPKNKSGKLKKES
ncbi:hypothetical protein TNCV_565001 [Trichonephila clavipes]|nr:hypothetical protein TNCV_565001 [Trichonephila clavipes]